MLHHLVLSYLTIFIIFILFRMFCCTTWVLCIVSFLHFLILFSSSYYYSEWFAALPGWKKQVNDRISLLVDLTGFFYIIIIVVVIIIIIILFFISSYPSDNISSRQVIGWGVQPREPGDEREGFR